MQTEHARRATQFAYQGHTSATSSAAASVLLGEIYGSMGNHGAALSAFTTAMTVLTQHGLRTRQGGAVMRHIGRCFLQQEDYRRSRSHLSEVCPRLCLAPCTQPRKLNTPACACASCLQALFASLPCPPMRPSRRAGAQDPLRHPPEAPPGAGRGA